MTTEHSANGWVASKDPNAIGIKHFKVKGTDIKLQCNEIAGPILAAFAAEFHVNVEKLDGGTFDDWSYAYRPIRGETTGLSNHASGSAMDLNSTKHPLGKAGTFNANQMKMINILCNKYKVKWGGTYKSHKDEMHFEMACTPDEAEALIIKLNLRKEPI